MRRTKLLTSLAVLAGIGASTLPAGAQDVTVALTATAPSRTVFVEDLTGAPLTDIALGSGRSVPFRVRAVDSAMPVVGSCSGGSACPGFRVLASMTNLYKVGTSGLDFTNQVDSARAALAYPTAGLNALDVQATAQPYFTLVGTLADTALCTALGTVGGSCQLSVTSALAGKLQAVNLDVDLANPANLPLIPQAGVPGNFANPDYAGVAAAAPRPSPLPTPTALRVLGGTTTGVDTTALVTRVNGALATTVAAANSAGTAATSLFATADTVTAAYRSAVVAALPANGATLFDALSGTALSNLVASTRATLANALTTVTAQAGTYLSFPTLSVDVPAATSSGTYRGTLVVTTVQP